MIDAAPLFETDRHRAVELGREHLSVLQAFIAANPEYYLETSGAPPLPTQAQEEFDYDLPAEWTFRKKWVLAFLDADDRVIGMCGLISDLFAPGVWHIGLFVVATTLHGRGTAQKLYRALEAWIHGRGGRWIRLGVVEGYARAERFWERLGYVEVRKRHGVAMGQRTHTVRVMVKPLASDTLSAYLELVARDRPDQTALTRS